MISTLRIFALCIAQVLFSVTLAAGAHQEHAGLALGQLSSWKIYVADGAIPSETFAAQELQSFYKQASGKSIPIVHSLDDHDGESAKTGVIYIGPSEKLSAVGIDCDPAHYGQEDLRIVACDDMLAIFGGRPRGTLYGVYTFLEDYMGIRFLTADHTHVPDLPAGRTIGPLDRTYSPPFGV